MDNADETIFSKISDCQQKARTSVERYDTHYDMNHKNRGIALIFNHTIFDNPNFLPRTGTDKDVNCLIETFKTLDFDVQLHNDLNCNDIFKRVQDAVQLDHTDNDCFAMVVLSHGDEGGILWAKDIEYKQKYLWKDFSADKCPSLKGKPKLFFIQACQGKKNMLPITLTETQSDTPDCSYIDKYMIPTIDDFIILFATVPGFPAHREGDTGSWFIQELCKELNKNAYQYDILTLATFVTQRVAIDYKVNTLSWFVTHKMKQLPSVIYTLTRLVQFNKKR